MKYKKSLYLIILTLLIGTAQANDSFSPENKNQAEQDRQLLLDNAYVIDELNLIFGVKKDSLEQIVKSHFDNIDVDNMVVFSDRNDYFSHRGKVDDLMADVDKLKLRNSNKDVIISDPEHNSNCDDIDIVTTATALTAFIATKIRLAAIEFSCLQLVAGNNVAASCLVLEAINAYASEVFEHASFCTDDTNYSENTAMFETVKSIGDHMNDYLDETTISSRATQSSVDVVQDSLDDANSTLDQYLPLLDTNLITGLTDLDLANQQLYDINSQSDSLLFRVQVNQVEIESIEILTSDIQQRSEEIRDDTQGLILATTSMQSQLLTAHANTQALISQANNNKIEHVLARNSDKASVSYQLPASQGGLLEAARELLINKISNLEALGTKVNGAKKLLAAGDGDYNNGQYKSAYANYSNSYQALLAASF
jgi:hypothetical protein